MNKAIKVFSTSRNYRDAVLLPTKLVNQAHEESWSRSLAYFARMKALFKNNCVYSWSARKLARLIDCSPTALSFHLKELESRGLIRRHVKNMTFIGLRQLMEIAGATKATTAILITGKNQFDVLRAQQIKQNLAQQKYRMKGKPERLLKDEKSSMVFTPYKNNERVISYPGIGCKGIGGLFYSSKSKNGRMSKSTGSRMRNKLEKIGIFRAKKIHSLLFEGISYTGFIILRDSFKIPSHSFFKGGRVLIERPTKLEYIEPGITTDRKSLPFRKVGSTKSAV